MTICPCVQTSLAPNSLDLPRKRRSKRKFQLQFIIVRFFCCPPAGTSGPSAPSSSSTSACQSFHPTPSSWLDRRRRGTRWDAEQPASRLCFHPSLGFSPSHFFPSSLLPPLGLVHPDRRIPTLLLPVLLLLGPDGGLAVLHGRHGPPQESHHTQALPVSWLGCVILFQTRLPNC